MRQEDQLYTRLLDCTYEGAGIENGALRVCRHAHHGRWPDGQYSQPLRNPARLLPSTVAVALWSSAQEEMPAPTAGP